MFGEIHRNALSVLPFAVSTAGASPRQEPVHRPEGLPVHEFIWVGGGSGLFTAGKESRTLTAGEGVFLRRSTPHSYEGEALSTLWYTFSGAEGLLDYLGVGDYRFFRVPDFLPRAFAEFYCNIAGRGSNLLRRSALGYAFTVDLLDAVCTPEKETAFRVRRYLENHYSDPLTLDDIAREAGMGRYAFCRYYHAARGKSVMDELRAIRLEKAKMHLRYSTEPIARIGALCGFESPSYFIRCFREEIGCTPLAYRKKHLPV